MVSKQRDTFQRKELARHLQDRKIAFNKSATPKILYLLKYPVWQLQRMHINVFTEVRVMVSDLLSKEPITETKIHSLQGSNGRETIKTIFCPICHKVLTIHKYWCCFFCENPEHGRKIFDVRYLKCEKLEFYESRIQELEGIALKIEFDPNRLGPYVPKVQVEVEE